MPEGREEITYGDLGVEQLGAVYERVLDLDPATPKTDDATALHACANRPARSTRRSHWRSSSCAARSRHSSQGRRRIGSCRLRVVDPAMGSGAFLVAACRYLAGAYERALVDEGRLAPGDVDEERRAAMRRLVAERCLAGVDANPVAVQLARLSLWLTTLAHGQTADVSRSSAAIGKQSDRRDARRPRAHAGSRPHAIASRCRCSRSTDSSSRCATSCARLPNSPRGPDETVADVRAKEAALGAAHRPRRRRSRRWRLAADAWCARWFPADGTRPASPAELRAVIDAIVRHDRTLPAAHLARRLSETRECEPPASVLPLVARVRRRVL